ncbi:MAG: hypothetical protein SGARI_001344 [Bacillariaceae sp.]
MSAFGSIAPPSASAMPQKGDSIQCRMSSFAMSAAASPEDDVTRQLERARAVLEASRAKVEAQEKAAEEEFSRQNKNGKKKVAMGADLPFFATQNGSNGKADGKRDMVIKDQNQDGLFTTDGDLMAKLSETEEWESRSLFEVFTDEIEKKEKDPFADRDVAASMYGLRKALQNEDFQKIFDKRNRFIGDQ